MSRAAAGAQRINHIRYPVVDTSEIMEIRAEIVEEIPSRVVNDTIYVAVGKDFKESQSILRWALHNSGGKPICIFHVHQPAEKIPIMGTKFRINQLEAHHVAAHHEKERQDMLKLLERYNQICQGSGVGAEVQYIEMGCIEKGIVELIVEHNVTRLVMGAAADKYYSRRMVEVRSSKAMYVRLQAAAFCHIQFICKGNLVFTRQGQGEGRLDGQMARSVSVGVGQNTSTTQDYRRVMSDNRIPSPKTSDEWSPSQLSTTSSDDLGQSHFAIAEVESNNGGFKQNPSVLERGMNDELYDQLVHAMAEADNSKRDAFEESLRRRKAERDAIEAKRRLKTSENLYAQELRQRQETDETLEKTKEQHGNIKKELHQVAQELRMALEHKSLLQSQIADSDQLVRDLEHKMFAAVDLLQNYKKERDELQIECDDALRLVEQLRAGEASTSNVSQYYTEFDFTEVKDATHNFDPSLKIGEGGYGSIYRGFLRHTEVAIKMLHSHSLQGPSEFQQEVNVLSKLRHPNLVTLIGACPDAWIIIYEYLSGGSLEDRLNCKDNTPPLSWQNRIRVAAELCSVLIFLHSCGVVHGDLKPANILLDKNLVSKLSDFGICRVLDQNEFTINNTSRCCRTDPKGTFVYMDPEFLSTGELTSKSDTYSFGIILLRLLTGRPALGLTKEVRYALDKENLKSILDPTAGDWPFVQAQQLALLAMDCCDIYRKNRPDLASEAWRVLEPMRVSCGLSSFREGSCHIPHYFVCPIFQEIMQDPVVAADGFTYEAEALKGWLDSGHNTSPMTNLDLPNTNLVQNHALRSAIQEWLHQP